MPINRAGAELIMVPSYVHVLGHLGAVTDAALNANAQYCLFRKKIYLLLCALLRVVSLSDGPKVRERGVKEHLLSLLGFRASPSCSLMCFPFLFSFSPWTSVT